jgi:hypothetical protein
MMLAAFCIRSIDCGILRTFARPAWASEKALLLRVQEITLPNAEGVIDHFAFDAKRKRVTGAALGNTTVEAVDTSAGRDLHGIAGGAAPQGVVFVGDPNRLFVANAVSQFCAVWAMASSSTLGPVKGLDLQRESDWFLNNLEETVRDSDSLAIMKNLDDLLQARQ